MSKPLGLVTGDEVVYDNGGGTSIGGLTDDDGTTIAHPYSSWERGTNENKRASA